jgi:hypothetical protein
MPLIVSIYAALVNTCLLYFLHTDLKKAVRLTAVTMIMIMTVIVTTSQGNALQL